MGDDGWAAADGVLDLKLEFDKKRTHAENVRRTRSATFLDDTQPTDADTLAPGSRWVAYNASQQRKNIQVISHDATNSRVYIHYLDGRHICFYWTFAYFVVVSSRGSEKIQLTSVSTNGFPCKTSLNL